MAFTLWSNEQLLGESDFELTPVRGLKRMGAFRPTALGATLLPVLTGINQALVGLGARLREEGITPKPFDGGGAALEQAITGTREGVAVIECARRLHALGLEVRDPSGEVMRTESIGVHDLQHLLAALPRPQAPAAALERAAQVAGRQLPRYFLSATLSSPRRTAGRPLAHVH